MLEILNQIDTQFFLLINGMHCDFFDHFMKLFTMRFIWAPMYATILLILFRKYNPRRAAVYVLAIILSVVLADQICATVIRPMAVRLRPSTLENPISAMVHVVDGYRGGTYGFPSCHAANSFALATILSLMIQRRRFTFFIFIWATLNSYSRIYLGVHYPGDLLIGAVIGAAGAYLCYILARYVCHILFTDGPVAPKDSIFTIPVGHNLITPSGDMNVHVSDLMILTSVSIALLIATLALIG